MVNSDGTCLDSGQDLREKWVPEQSSVASGRCLSVTEGRVFFRG